ncbi:S-adenosyl-L-methionine-dependent methyltransferase [Glarea lozoyensis ATCC 20868]|uniref:S-adenosyl-L-methionine-dependent methyltransferase n=1 Tax=Glarea lozoyensis (strain ATCC 20868 / MF5171) TaxID=1116229 RepID=S3CT79_GLAL2|nr:S-adenosyl-L-methionine-dependent methyltransferase [Glarea lozoyensis ATCC 20868]EPE28840.1 S-adenosyl-L-methionine-dependent methyltransferase [Glarea lozoyensis ATCC 20868]
MSAQDKPQYSEPVYTTAVDRARYPFYIPNIEKKLVPETRELLEKYSHIPLEQQSEHVHKIRDQAWQIRAYPCTGVGAWLVPQLCKLPIYPEILRRVNAGETFVDIGCFVGHDLRRLAYDGAPSNNLYGVDIVSHWDVGYEMFRDHDRFRATFIEADILSDAPALMLLKGKIDILSVTQVLHQWDWDAQVKVAKVLTTFTKPGSLIVGNQIGNPNAQEVTLKSVSVPMWRHNPASFEKFWAQVGNETGTKWEVQCWMRSFQEMSWDSKDGAWMEEGVGIIEFVVKQV